MKKLVHRVLWCSQLLKKNLGVPLESGLCMYMYSLKIKTVCGLLHAAVKTSRGGVFLLVRGPHGSAGCPSIRALGFQVSIQSGNMRCLFLSKWVQIFCFSTLMMRLFLRKSSLGILSSIFRYGAMNPQRLLGIKFKRLNANTRNSDKL